MQDGKEIHFVLDFDQTKTLLKQWGNSAVESMSKFQPMPIGPSGSIIRRTLQIEAYDDFPNILLSSCRI